MKVLHRPRAVTLLACLTLTLTACGGGTEDGKASDRPVKGGTLKFAVNTEPALLDPHASPQDVTALFARPVLDSLVSMDKAGNIHPWLAKSWKISKDQKTYTFELRRDVEFSDGTRFDAEAVKANLDRIVDPKTKSELAAGFIEPYKSSKVKDDWTVEVTFDKPHAPVLSSFSTAYFGMQSPEHLKKGADAIAKKLVGSGPFRMQEYTPKVGVTYSRNNDYKWEPEGSKHSGPAYLDTLEFSISTEESGRLGVLNSNQADAVANVAPAAADQVGSSPNLRIDKRQAPGGVYSYFPNTEKGPFKDRRVREAFRDGIRFEVVVENLYFKEHAFAGGTPLSPTTFGYDKQTAQQREYSPKKAAKLLDDAGWDERDSQEYRVKNGKRLSITWPYIEENGSNEQSQTLTEQIQAEAKNLGFEVKPKLVTLAEYQKQYVEGDYGMMDLSWRRSEPDSLRNLFHSESIPTPEKFGTNGARFNDEKTDGWLEAALATTDKRKREQYYAKAQQRIAEQAAAFPVYVETNLMGRSKDVHGITFDPQAYPVFYDAWKPNK